MPAYIDPVKVGQSLPLVGILTAAALGVISQQSGMRFLPRWVILSLFSWTAFGFNNYLEARFFSPTMASSYQLLNNFASCLTCSLAVALLFRPALPHETFWTKARAFFASRRPGSWAWRFLGAWAAFPVAYFVFGMLVSPFVISYYQQEFAGLALPTLNEMLVLVSVRSLFFLLCILPVLITWKGSRVSLFLELGVALFLFVGGISMLQAIWLPAVMRAAHSLEILADSYVHAAALVFLLVPVTLAVSRETFHANLKDGFSETPAKAG
jgi:hypothetical protein